MRLGHFWATNSLWVLENSDKLTIPESINARSLRKRRLEHEYLKYKDINYCSHMFREQWVYVTNISCQAKIKYTSSLYGMRKNGQPK